MLHRMTMVILVLAALLVLVAIVAGLMLVIHHFKGIRNQKILKEKYLPMIKDKKVLELIERYSPKDQLTLVLAYLCFGSNSEIPKTEAEEQLAEIASSLEFAAEDDTSGYVDSLLMALNNNRLSVNFSFKKEFHYKVKGN